MIVKMSEKLLLRHRSMLFTAIMLITGLTLEVPYAYSQPEITSFTANGSSGTVTTVVGNTVTFECVADDSAIGYNWDFDGNGIADSVTGINSVVHTYTVEGTFNATCTVGDAAGKFNISDVIKMIVIGEGTPPTTFPSPGISANRLTIGSTGNLKIDISLEEKSVGSSLADTGPADFWVYATIPGGTTFYYNPSSSAPIKFEPSATPKVSFQGTLPDFSGVNVLDVTGGLPPGVYVFTFSVDDNEDGVKDDTYTASVTVEVRNVSFKRDIAPLFTGTGAWFNYDSGRDTDEKSVSLIDGPNRGCGSCHAGDVDGDGDEACPPECHLMDLNTYAGWMAGADGGTEPLLGEAVAGTPPFDWSKSKLRKRLRNNRMPPGIPFNIDEANRNGGDVDTSDDGNDIDLGGGKFFVNVAGTTGRGEVEYGGADNAVGLLEAYVASLDGATTGYAGVAGAVVFADVAGLFSEPNVWYNGGLACTACHYCDEEPPCFHEIDFTSQDGLLAGADGGSELLLGEDEATGGNTYNWGESGLRARLRNNRMPPNAPFELFEYGRNGPIVTHPLTGKKVTALDLIGEWVTGPDGVKGTSDDAKNN